MAFFRTFYRLLLRLYPARFREEYAIPLERQFCDDYRDQHGIREHVAFWLHALRDLALSIPVEILHEIGQDLRCSARVYRRRPLTTALALVALALAIGVTTGVFSVVSALLLRGLPFRQPERLARISMFTNLVAGRSGIQEWGRHSPYLEGAAEFASAEVTLAHSGEPVRVKVTEASSNFFDVLGVQPEFGRGFAAGEDVPGRDAVAVIGHGLWQQLFGGDSRVLGSVIRLNGEPLTVVGVAPPRFDYPARSAVWTATGAGGGRLPRPAGVVDVAIIGRLRPGIGFTRARAMFLSEIQRAYPEGAKALGPGFSRFVPLRDELAGPVRQASMILLGAAAFVLLIACANVAQLLLSRTTERRQELAVRAALGASRARLVQQLVTEALALTLAGAMAGLAVAPLTSRLVASAQPAPSAAQAYTILDWRVLGFAVAVAILTGLLFGVLPALIIGRTQPSHELMGSQPGVARSRTGRVRAGLIAMQAALTMVLLAGSMTMGRGFLRLLGVDLGFRTDHVLSMTVSMAGSPDRKDREIPYYHAALDRLRAVPGVEAVGAVKYLPLVESDYQYLGGRFQLESGSVVAGNIVTNPVTSDYFRAIGAELTAGRDFTDGERRGSEAVAVVNEEFAKRSGLGAALVGRKATSAQKRTYTIVGVVRNIRLGGPASVPPPQIYLPVEQSNPGSMTFVARVRSDAAGYLPVCRKALQQVNPEIPLYDVKTLNQRLSDTLARPRLYTTAVLFLGAFALFLAIIGIYGVAAYSVAQRTHEIGVRIAVGASPVRLRASLARQSVTPATLGTAAGVVGAALSGKYLQHLIRSAEPAGIQTCAVAGLVLAATALAAVWLATSLVIRIDPMAALKTE